VQASYLNQLLLTAHHFGHNLPMEKWGGMGKNVGKWGEIGKNDFSQTLAMALTKVRDVC